MRIPDDEWIPAKDKAAENGETMTDVIRRALRRYVTGALALVMSVVATGCAGASTTTPAVVTLTPTATATAAQTIAPCKEEDGSGQALPCRWDASVSWNGVGLSFTVRRAADGGTTYIYDNGRVDHVPPVSP